ncbi:sclerostin [Leucoraja erinacea]|uniref:sclerostin n=1 Tax=Leucoraja erinaceus TaxID=7782 RepID=UPI00245400DC|nr:sclerostin [Leucoraja erinacea]
MPAMVCPKSGLNMGHLQPYLIVASLCTLLVRGGMSLPEGWRSLKNDATEIVHEYTDIGSDLRNHSSNQAKLGGRGRLQLAVRGAGEFSCRELRSTRYISDGMCRSVKPVKELVCSGQCMPAHLLPNSIGRIRWWSRHQSSDYRCVAAHSRTQRVRLECQNRETRTYKIQVVTSCKCKRYSRHHNQSDKKQFEMEATRRRKSKKVARSKNRGVTNQHDNSD